MNVLGFVAEVVLITASGALSPGPLSIATLSLGARKGWKSGFYAAIGHTLVEFPMVVLLFLGLADLVKSESFQILTALIGGASLIFYALLQARDALRMLRKDWETKMEARDTGGLYVGFMLSAFNPFFLIWWATVGIKLVVDAVITFGHELTLAISCLYVSHVWMDYAWLTFLSYLGYKGKKLGMKRLAIVLLIFSMILLYYGLKFLTSIIM